MNISLPPGQWQPFRAELIALHLVALALLLSVTVSWGSIPGRRRVVISGIVSVIAILLAYVSMVRARDIPVDWITVLQVGLERKNIMHLYTRGVHAGANFGFVLSTVAGGYPTLYHAIWLNLLLALINATIFFHVALAVTGPLWALVWTLVFALNPAMFLASFSELPANLLALYCLAGVIAWAVLYDPLPLPRAMRGAAYAACAALTVLVGITRIEVALIGVVALGLHAAYTMLGPRRWSAAGKRLGDAGRSLLAYLSNHPGVVAVLCVAGWVLGRTGVPGLIGRQQLISFYPFYPATLSLYAYLPLLALPIGVSLACVFGFVHAAREFRRFGGLALSLAMLSNAYFAAWYEYFEMGRYVSYILAAIFFLGIFGKAEFEKLVERYCSPNLARGARIVYLMAWFTLPLPGVIEYYARPDYRWSDGVSQLLLDRDTQREVRHLINLTETNPQCVFVGRTVIDSQGDFKIRPRYAYAVFGASLAEPEVVPEEEMGLDALASRYAAKTACLRLYFGTDCNLTFTDRCRDFIAGHQLIEETRFPARPFINPLESGSTPPEIVLATYAFP